MTTTATKTANSAASSFIAALTRPAAQVGAQAPWLALLRAEAVDRVGVLTVPTTRDEDWRFTDISALTQMSFQPPVSARELTAADIAGFELPEVEARLVFVDGVYAPQLSFNRTGLVVENLTRQGAALDPGVKANLGRHVSFENEIFSALNTAFLRDGALISVPRDKTAAPLHLLFIATQAQAVSYPRCLVLAEAGSKATIIEDFVTLENGSYFSDGVTEMVLAEGAQIEHVRVQRDSAKAFHIASCAVVLGRASRYNAVSIALGAQVSRYNLNVETNEGSSCIVDGLALITERQLADTHTCIDHAHPNGVSRQLHKCIVDGAAHAVFNGKILVRPGAQRTDSSQSSKNLLLTRRARVDTKPQLEIFADDVKCAHGATVGQLDAEEIFYLRSRGFADSAARNLLTFAFGAEIIARIPSATLKQRLEHLVLEQTARQR